MTHFGDYVDGVPVKISEKYKRPPRIELPHSVSESPIRAQNVVDNVQYCTTFEQNILSKLKELKSAKETKKNERRHRLQLLEEAKQKKLDAIAAAEAEEKLKQLSVSEVSYPSTDEISALSQDDRNDKSCGTTCVTGDNSPERDNTVGNGKEYICTQEPQPNILQPIQIQSNYQINNLLDDPDPLQDYKMHVNMTKIPNAQNVDMMTFKDFENDTSSPFDNVELKTINDMELLAQVLQSQKQSSASIPQNYNTDQYTTCSTHDQLGRIVYQPNVYIDQTIGNSNTVYTSPQHYPATNGYYVPDTVCDSTVPVDNVYAPNYQYFVPQPYTIPTSYYNSQMPTTSVDITNGYIPQPYYYHYPQASTTVPYVQNTYGAQEVENAELVPSGSTQASIKSRSRSVPDIVKELNDEVVSARIRATERSCNTSPGTSHQDNIPRSLSNSEKKERRKKAEVLPNPYDRLSVEVQTTCKNIHGMGFPLDRVARVCSLVGKNDKRIIECLLVLGELMDLGFSEGRVTAALAKHEFNRDKALDDLVS